MLLVSFDGFRHDYLQMAKAAGKATPNFDFLIANGVTVDDPGITNTFVTVTFPNHFSIVTGMYEETHGVVGNYMYDTMTQKIFTVANSSTDPFWFHNGSKSADHIPEPIWITNQKSSDRHRHSGVMFWPGSEVRYEDMLPFHWEIYNSSFPNESRIERVISWFNAKSSPINLGLLYFGQPDHLGHQVGPNSDLMMDMIVALDGLVGCLIRRLQDVNLFDSMNLIITSDHGMEQIIGAVQVDQYIEPALYDTFGGTTVWNILPKPGQSTTRIC